MVIPIGGVFATQQLMLVVKLPDGGVATRQLLPVKFFVHPRGREVNATFVAVAAISAAIIAYELLLMRLFSIIGWHHFAYMIISIALLGFGASGSALALTRAHLLHRFHEIFAACAALFAASALLSFAAAMRLPFNALQSSGTRGSCCGSA